jgi:hypothetical protein
MLRSKILLLCLLAGVSPAIASTVNLTFDIHVWDSLDLVTNTSSPENFDGVVVVRFDSGSSVGVYPNFVSIDFGTPTIRSPITALLPYGSHPIQTDDLGRVMIGNMDKGPGQQFSWLAIQQNQYDQETENTFWARALALVLLGHKDLPCLRFAARAC